MTSGRMATLVWEGPRQMAIREAPIPARTAGDVLVRVAAAGICGSELEGYVGRMANRIPPLVMGHEFSGTVVDADDGALIGARVVANPLISCWRCDMCRSGRPHLCPTRRIIGIHTPGAFAEFVVVPEVNVVVLPAALSLEGGALVEPLAVVVHAAGLAWAKGIPESALVIGAGSLGLLATQLLAHMGIDRLVVTDLAPSRLKLALALGANQAIEVHESKSGPNGDEAEFEVDVVFDCVGSAQTKVEAVRRLRAGGIVVLLGLHDDTLPISSQELVRREITLCGAVTYTPRDFRRGVELLASGGVTYQSWTERRPLGDGPRSFDELLKPSGNLVKVLLGDGGGASGSATSATV